MQNSELYRRGFVVPLDRIAEHAVMSNNVNEETCVHYYELPNQGIFDELWDSSLFQLIHLKLGVRLDDYEEERIVYQNLQPFIELIKKFEQSNTLAPDVKIAITELTKLTKLAIEKKTSLFFVL